MRYTTTYQSPIGEILLVADDIGLTGLWFEGEKHYALNLDKENQEKEIPIFAEVKCWLDIYFSGKKPGFMPKMHILGTEFQKEVWQIICMIPYGETITYGEIADKMANKKGIGKMSAQAVGNAVGRNNLPIIIPCHRVIGKNGSLTGYTGGIDKKIRLLKLERGYKNEYFVPKK